MFKRIERNPLLSFFFRISVVVFISSVFLVTTLYFYYENQLAKKLNDSIIHFSNKSIELFKKVDLEKKNQEYFDFLELLNDESEKSKTIFIEIYDTEEKLLLKHNFLESQKKLDNLISKLDRKVSNLNYNLIPINALDVYFYYQFKELISQKYYYINILKKVDEDHLETIKEETYFTIFIVCLTIFIITISIFPIIYKQYKKLLQKQNELMLSNLNLLTSLGNAIAKRDSDTNEHNYRVTYYSLKIAQAMNLKNENVRALIKGSFLHDIGKIAISDNILLKAGKLDEEEFEIMKTHVVHGVEIINGILWLEDAKKVILYHHEKVNGTGYPNKLQLESIPIEARIFSIADVFDALTSQRPYKKAFDINTSFQMIQQDSGIHFDPDIVKIFEIIYEELYYDVSEKTSEELKKTLEPILLNSAI